MSSKEILNQFVRETKVKGDHFWIVIDTSIDISEITDMDIFNNMDNLVAIAKENKHRINLVVDAKNINPLRFDIKKFIRIQKYFSEKHNDYVDNIFIMNMNKIFQGIQKMITPFLDSSYTSKIKYPTKK